MSKTPARSLPQTSLEHPIGTLAIVVGLLVAGAIAIYGLPINLMPDIVYPMVRVQVAASQTPPEILLNTVTRVLEQELVQAERLETMESTTEQGQVQITLSFAVDRDVDDALKDVSTWVDRARSKLPANIEPPTIFKFDPQNLPVTEFVLSSDTMDITRLREFAEYDLAYRFIGVPGVSGIRVAGGRVREIQVRVAPDRLRAHGLTMQDLAASISASNVQAPAGRVDALEREFAGQVQSLFSTPAEIGHVVVRIANGQTLEIGQLAEVIDTHREQRLIVTVNGKEGVKLSAFKIPEANSVEVAGAIRQRLNALQADRVIPLDVTLATTADESVYINQSIRSATHALALAAALVALTVLFFLKDWKFTLVSVAVLPVALVITALLMRVFGLSLNLMSIGGLIVGVALLVDYGIVLLENITRHWAAGKSVNDAVAAASNEVTGSLLGSLSVLIMALVPFLVLGGLALVFFSEFLLVIIFATAAGLVAAMAIIPAVYPLLVRFAEHERIDEGRVMHAVNRGYTRILAYCIRHTHSVLATALMGVVIAGLTVSRLGYTFLPEIDDGRVTITIQGRPGMLLRDLRHAVQQVSRLALQDRAVTLLDVTEGGRIGQTIQERPGEAEILIQIGPKTTRANSVQDWMSQFDAQIEAIGLDDVDVGVRKARIRAIRTFAGSAAFGDFDVAVRVQGPDPQVLATLGKQVQTELTVITGLSDLTTTLNIDQPMVDFSVDPQRAAVLGVSPVQVAETIQAAIYGTVPSRFLDRGLYHDIRLVSNRTNLREKLLDVTNLPVQTSGNGDFVLLGQLADVRLRKGPIAIDRINQGTVNMVTATVRGRVLGDVATDVRQKLASFTLPTGYSISYGGRMATLESTGGGMIWVAALALLLVGIVLAVLYESLLDAAVTLVVLPLGAVGAGAALWLTDTPLSSTAIIGMVLLVGISGNNAVVLIGFIRQIHRAGHSLAEAVTMGATLRLRPKLMTALVAVSGMIPLAFGDQEASEILEPLAITVIGGIPASLIATLIVLPVLYLVFHSRKAAPTP